MTITNVIQTKYKKLIRAVVLNTEMTAFQVSSFQRCFHAAPTRRPTTNEETHSGACVPTANGGEALGKSVNCIDEVGGSARCLYNGR